MMKRPGLSIVSSQSGREDVCYKLQETNCEDLEDYDDHEDEEDEDSNCDGDLEAENDEKAVCQRFVNSSISETQLIWQN